MKVTRTSVRDEFTEIINEETEIWFVGASLGLLVGETDGDRVGMIDGTTVGILVVNVGFDVGYAIGCVVGCPEG